MNPRLGAVRAPTRIVALDVSQSWLRASDSTAWERARQRAARMARDSLLLVGQTIRYGPPPSFPADTATLLREAVERAQLAGRPLMIVTDGESEISAEELRRSLPVGSAVAVEPVQRGPDLAIIGLETPPAAVAGDTVAVRVSVAAAEQVPGAAELVVLVDGRTAARRTLLPLAAWDVRVEHVRVTLPPGGPEARVSVAIGATGDREPRNDTASRVIRRGERMSAVAVSTAPDLDFREIVRVLRGTLSLPTSARFRIAPTRWIDELGRAVPEAQVRAEIARAQIVLLHGDTGFFGAPRVVTPGALALVPLVEDDSEWYVSSALASPLALALAGLPFDSLPPVAVGRRGEGTPLLELRGAGQSTELLGTLQDSARRVIALPVRGTSRWALRGGAAADAFVLFWGSVFAALSERPGARFAVAPAVIPPRELHPQRAVLASGPIGGAAAGVRTPLRSTPWPYLILVALLCGEWLLRRRGGLR